MAAAAPQQHGEVARVVRGRQQQHRLHRRRAAAGFARGTLFHAGGEVQLVRKWGRTRRSCSGVSSVGSSSRASGLPPLSAMSRSVTSGAGASLRRRPAAAARPSGIEPGQLQLGDAVRTERCRCAVSGREHHEHAVRADPPRAEQQCVRRGGVEPVSVVDDAQDECSPRPPWSASTTSRRPPGMARPPGRPPRRTRPAALAPAGRAAARAAASREQQPVQGCERQRRLDLEPLRSQHQSLVGVAQPARPAGPTCRRLVHRGRPRCRRPRAAPVRAARCSCAISSSRPTSTQRPYYRATPVDIAENPAL